MAQKFVGRGALLLAAAVPLVISGCASRPQPLYHWGSFQDQQYSYFKGDRGPEDAIQNLEKVREEARSKSKSVPPGLLAHLGLLYGQVGRTDLFEQNLLAEQRQFPESSAYVDFLMKKNKAQ